MAKLANVVGPALLLGAALSVGLPAPVQAEEAFGGYFGRYFLPDGSQERNSRVIAGAAPNNHATYLGGIRCEYRYIGSGPGRKRYQICE